MVVAIQDLEVFQMYYFLVGLIVAIINLKPFLAEFRKHPKYGMYIDSFMRVKIIVSVLGLAVATVFWPVVFADLLGNFIGKKIYESRKKRGIIK